MAAVPTAHPHLSWASAHVAAIVHGHHDQSRRRARAQKARMPFGERARGPTRPSRQLRRRRTRHVCGRLRTRTGAPDGSYSVLTPKEVNDATGCSLAESAAPAPLRMDPISLDNIDKT